MAVTLNPGQSVTLQATPVYGNGDVDPNATVSWSESSGGAVVSMVDNGNGSATFTYVADGASTVTAAGVDGETTVTSGTDNPDTITCVAPPQVLTAVNITEGAVS